MLCVCLYGSSLFFQLFFLFCCFRSCFWFTKLPTLLVICTLQQSPRGKEEGTTAVKTASEIFNALNRDYQGCGDGRLESRNSWSDHDCRSSFCVRAVKSGIPFSSFVPAHRIAESGRASRSMRARAPSRRGGIALSI